MVVQKQKWQAGAEGSHKAVQVVFSIRVQTGMSSQSGWDSACGVMNSTTVKIWLLQPSGTCNCTSKRWAGCGMQRLLSTVTVYVRLPCHKHTLCWNQAAKGR